MDGPHERRPRASGRGVVQDHGAMVVSARGTCERPGRNRSGSLRPKDRQTGRLPWETAASSNSPLQAYGLFESLIVAGIRKARFCQRHEVAGKSVAHQLSDIDHSYVVYRVVVKLV